MHAWAALRSADIVQAARGLRDAFTGAKADDEAQEATPADAPSVGKPVSQETGAAE